MALLGVARLAFLPLMVMGANRCDLLAHFQFLQMPQHIFERMPTESTMRAIFGTWAPGSSGGDSRGVSAPTTPPAAFCRAGMPVPQAWAGSRFPEHPPSAGLPVPQPPGIVLAEPTEGQMRINLFPQPLSLKGKGTGRQRSRSRGAGGCDSSYM